jgi:putative peptidoglycan lipid II flippase
MLKNLLKVGGWTLASRITGFVRDILMAAILGASPLMDAFAVAFRLPNHFRAIFAEGAFSSAFIPAYTRIRTQQGETAGNIFHGRILSYLLLSQIVLLALALFFTSGLVDLLAPGFKTRDIYAETVELTRITFPYLFMMTLVTLWAGALNAIRHFTAAAAAPILLNLTMIATIAAAASFRTPAHAAAWGVLIAGVLEAALLWFAAMRAGVFARPRMPRLDPQVRSFFKAFLPAVIGSAGVQIAMLADTIIVTFLPSGGASALYYADRLYQLPVGVIGIAAGTVLLPEMARLIAAGDATQAHHAQNRAMGFTLLLAAPFLAAFIAVPDFIIAGLFQRGKFDERATLEAAQVLAAYTIGLPPILLIRSAVASFTARGDTRTPLWASLSAIAVNLALKLVLWNRLGAPGLAFATAIGAWVNLTILWGLASAQGKTDIDARFGRTVLVAAGGALAATIVLRIARAPIIESGDYFLPRLQNEWGLFWVTILGALTYGGVAYWLSRKLKVPLARR